MRGAVDLSSLRSRGQSPAPTAGGTPGRPGAENAAPATGAPPLVFDVTEADFGQVLELSRTVPVVVDLRAEWAEPSVQLSPVLEKVVTEFGGRLVLARIDVDASPQLAQSFRAQSIPLVVGLIAGQPVQLFSGAVPEAQLREVLGKLLELAAGQGVTGSVPTGADPAAAPVEETLPPLHQEAFDAIERGDYAAAAEAYEKALGENARDEDARSGLAQVRLLARVQPLDLASAREAAASAPGDVDAQFAVADLDLAGGHVEDAFTRLLDLFAGMPADERAPVRERLLELFGVVGDTDPRVLRARGRLASLLF